MTARDLFHTKRGKETQRHCNNDPSEFYGHSAIMFYYELDPDKYTHCHFEKTDLTSPEGFPKELVTAILSGDMAEFGVDEGMVSGLLSDKGRRQYKKQCKADAAWRKAAAAWRKADAKVFWAIFANVKYRAKAWCV